MKIDAARPYSITYRELGDLYLAALSISIRGKGISIISYLPPIVTAEALGYSIEQLRELAKENLGKAYAIDNKKEIDLALKAVDALSVEAFEELERYEEDKRKEDERQNKERMNRLFDEINEEEQKGL